MKTIRIYALPSHQEKEKTHGVDMARIIQPMRALDGFKTADVEFKVDLYDINEKDPADWKKVAKTHDIIYLNYINNPWGYAAMGAMARGHGVKLVLDLDDGLWQIRKDNPASEVYAKDGEAIRNFTAICNDVDYMTTTNDYLKHVIMNNTKKNADQIKVFPNYIDLELYKHRSKFKDDGQIRLLHYGSSTHQQDLRNRGFVDGIDRIMKEYPNVTFKTIGAFIPEFKEKWGQRYETGFGERDIYKWINGKFPGYMDEADILVVPVDKDIYNQCKSNIKYLEASSAKIPGIYQDIRQYHEVMTDELNGMLASNAATWYISIKTLIEDPLIRQQMGEVAFKDVQDHWQMKDHVKDYANFFEGILTEDNTKSTL